MLQFNDLGTQLAHMANVMMLEGMSTEEAARHLFAYKCLQEGASVEESVAIATGQQDKRELKSHGGVIYQSIAAMRQFCEEKGIEIAGPKGRRNSWTKAIQRAGYVLS